MRRYLIPAFAICILLMSCQFNSTYSNREEDREAAEAVVSEIYQLIREKKYAKTYPFFSERFLEVTDTAQIRNIYLQSDTALGDIEDRTVINWNTNSIVGTNTKTEYFLVYKIDRAKWDSKETWRREKEGEEIKVLAYNVDSDFFNKGQNRTAK